MSSTAIVQDQFYLQQVTCIAGESLGFKISDIRAECNELGLPLCRFGSTPGAFCGYVPLPNEKVGEEVQRVIAGFSGISSSIKNVEGIHKKNVLVCELRQNTQPYQERYSPHSLSIHLRSPEGRDFIRALSAAFTTAHETDLSMPATGPVLLMGQVCNECDFAPSSSEMFEGKEVFLYPVPPHASLFIPASIIREGEGEVIEKKCRAFVREHKGMFIRLEAGDRDEHQVAFQVQIPVESLEALRHFARNLGADIKPSLANGEN